VTAFITALEGAPAGRVELSVGQLAMARRLIAWHTERGGAHAAIPRNGRISASAAADLVNAARQWKTLAETLGTATRLRDAAESLGPLLGHAAVSAETVGMAEEAMDLDQYN
jgi:hypothetical protein